MFNLKHKGFLLFVIAVLVILVAPLDAMAKDIKLNVQFSGGSHFTPMDTNLDGYPMIAGSAETTGTLGRAKVETVFEFTELLPGSNPDCFAEAVLVHESHIAIYRDGSMMFFEATYGDQCVDNPTGQIYAVFGGDITGGTGRFAGASGDWEIYSPGFRVGELMMGITGTMTGTLVLPD